MNELVCIMWCIQAANIEVNDYAMHKASFSVAWLLHNFLINAGLLTTQKDWNEMNGKWWTSWKSYARKST